MTEIVVEVIKIVLGGAVGLVSGLALFGFFNRMPARWLCDYKQEPSAELMDKGVKRIKAYPWKYVMGGFLCIAVVRMSLYDIRFAMAGMVVLWALMAMAVADWKYMVVPDQLILILLVAAFGFIPFYDGWQEPVIGAGVGFFIVISTAVIGKLIYKKDTVGGGDIKLYTALGLVFGGKGFLIIFVITTLLSAGHFAILMIRKKITGREERPLVPYIFAGTAVYLLIVYEII